VARRLPVIQRLRDPLLLLDLLRRLRPWLQLRRSDHFGRLGLWDPLLLLDLLRRLRPWLQLRRSDHFGRLNLWDQLLQTDLLRPLRPSIRPILSILCLPSIRSIRKNRTNQPEAGPNQEEKQYRLDRTVVRRCRQK
jgi:hypothetical protein